MRRELTKSSKSSTDQAISRTLQARSLNTPQVTPFATGSKPPKSHEAVRPNRLSKTSCTVLYEILPAQRVPIETQNGKGSRDADPSLDGSLV